MYHINNARSISNRTKEKNRKNRGIEEYNKLDKDESLKNILLSSLSLNELRSISKLRKIKNYENMSDDEMQNAFENSKTF